MFEFSASSKTLSLAGESWQSQNCKKAVINLHSSRFPIPSFYVITALICTLEVSVEHNTLLEVDTDAKLFIFTLALECWFSKISKIDYTKKIIWISKICNNRFDVFHGVVQKKPFNIKRGFGKETFYNDHCIGIRVVRIVQTVFFFYLAPDSNPPQYLQAWCFTSNTKQSALTIKRSNLLNG